ncbi:MAG: signal recognition particle-docking protein FtsY [Clostridiales bacterium]|jgi:fused signal recognition particle receptor|nr:signal recognition particle-docking protein FtsY [Clostridiales bacterium]
MSIFSKIAQGLSRTKANIAGAIDSAFAAFGKLSNDFYDEIEEALILSDAGMSTAEEASALLRERVRAKGIKSAAEARDELRSILIERLGTGDTGMKLGTKPSVILVVGVNGVGKTTTIGKLAAKYTREGKQVVLCAADTFRAAAAEQLEVWAGRAGCAIVSQKEGADPASVVYDAISAARARNADLLICDTAGRLHNKKNLMSELGKIARIIKRELPGCDVETLLVIDAVTGQNGLAQAKEFMQSAGLTGIVLTKLDGTAKGGIVLAISSEMKIPVKFIGVGEQIDDLMEFDAAEYVRALI